MNQALTDLAIRFVNNELTGDEFSETFIARWKEERDDRRLLQDPPEISEMLSTIFCLADLYNPAVDRESYEFDEETLRGQVRGELRNVGAFQGDGSD